MTSKRFRRPKMREKEIRLYYGKDEPYNSPDLCVIWGPGTDRGTAHLLLSMLGRERTSWNGKTEPSIFEELKTRGYDITSLKFSIKKL